MSVFDIFNNDAFSLTTMLNTVDSMEFKPTALGDMKIFTPNPVRTESVAIESRDGVLNLIATSQRGAPIEHRTTEKRKLRDFRSTRIAKGDRIVASELAFLRGHGEEQQVAMLQEEIARRLNGPAGLMDDIDLTLEHMRLGAIQGIVYDSDGSTEIYNFYTEFGVTQDAEIAFNLTGLAEGELRTKCTQLTRTMKRKSGGAFTPQTRVHAFCGDDFFDALVSLAEVRQQYLNRDLSKYVPGAGAFETVEYGGITWQNYQGTDDNTKVAIAATEVKFFPVNAPGAFLEVWSPGEQFEQIGKVGQKVYPMIVRDTKRDHYVDIEAYSYPLHICTRPRMLQRGRLGV